MTRISLAIAGQVGKQCPIGILLISFSEGNVQWNGALDYVK